MSKTTQDVDALKRNWRSDPCWDIETTEGYEEHHDELLACRHECERQWRAERQAALIAKAEQLGVPNLRLAEYIEGLERRIEAQQRRIDVLTRWVEQHEARCH